MFKIIILVVIFVGLSDAFSNKCPQIQCPADKDIPNRCRKPQFLIGLDNQTRCPGCAASYCGDMMEVCPSIQCPMEHTIPEECRKPNYEIGTDNISLCPMCASNGCGDPNDPKICRPVGCPYIYIPKECVIPQFFIGTDGITMCEDCPLNGCI